MRRRAALSVLGGGLIALACAGAPRREAQAPPRMKDSPPEKVAAQRAAANNLQLEAEDQRWGIEAARQRRRDSQQKQRPPAAPAPADVTGPVDLRQTPAPPGTTRPPGGKP
jgi:hypothetical protein